MNSSHEALAVIFEELDEFWDEVARSGERMLRLVQAAGMCVRAANDLPLTAAALRAAALDSEDEADARLLTEAAERYAGKDLRAEFPPLDDAT